MGTLPFLINPAAQQTRRIGNNRCGIIEMPERGGLTVAESDLISDMLASQQSAFVEGARMADHVAKEENISLTEAFKILESAINGKPADEQTEAIRLRHAERIQKLVQIYSAAGRANMEATVTALVRSRLGQPEWTVEDTRKLDKVLFDGIWKLASDEQAAEAVTTEPPTEEELGKPQPATGAGKRPTGKKSSGS